MKWFSILSDKEKQKVKNQSQPAWIEPMLAKLTHNYFSDEEWIFERKLDGERCLGFKKNNNIRLLSRNKKELNSKYPELVQALEKQTPDFIIDGEIVAFENNLTSFSKLQNRMHKKEKESEQIAVYFYVFDLIFFMGSNISKLPLKSRKKIIKNKFDFESENIRYLQHHKTHGLEYHKEACKKGWEGIIAKDGNAEYVHSRSSKWLKFKCENRQEFIICGYTDPQGERKAFGALLLGYYEKGNLKYAGKAGTGFDDETLDFLYNRMQAIEQDKSPFNTDIKEKNVHWLPPKLVAEIQFTEWTNEGKLRHPSYQGLRDDKPARQVVRE